MAIALALVLGAAPVSAASVVTNDDTTSYSKSAYWIDGTDAGVNGTTVDTPHVTYAIAIGNQTKVYADNGLAFGSNTYTGKALTLNADGKLTYTNAEIPLIDFGTSTISGTTASKNSLAFGQSTASWGDQATAFGNETMASSTNATAFGQSTRATADQATAFGNSTLAKGINATASGLETTASGKNSTAVGWRTTASGDTSFAGGEENTASGRSSTVFGRNNEATATNAVAFGGTTFTNKKGEQYQTKNVASGVSSVAFGEGTKATALGAVSFGNNTQAGNDDGSGGQDSVAFGNSTKATGGRAVAFGEGTTASYTDATAFGYHTVASAQGATAFGNKSQATSHYATAWGGGDRIIGKDANGKDIKTGPIASGVYSTAFGSGTQAVAHNAVAWGQESVAGSINDDGTFTVTQADGTTAKALVINGYGYKVAPDWGDPNKIRTITVDGKEYPVLLTTDNKDAYIDDNGEVHYRYNSNPITLKDLQVVQGTYSGSNATAFGYQSQALGTNSLAALGGIVDKDTSNAAAIGSGAEAKLSDSIALGSGAVANRAAQTAGYDPKTKASSTATTDNTWTSTASGIAIGDVTYNADGTVDTTKPVVTRQLTGLAAGTYDTDAVNVAQLKAAMDSAGTHDYSVNSIMPDNDQNYNNTGAKGDNALAAGVSATATGENDTAVGKSAHASGGGAVAIGNNVFSGTSIYDNSYKQIAGKVDNSAGTSKDTVAIGNSSMAAGENSVALGKNARAGYNVNHEEGTNTLALGADATAFGDHSIAIGNGAGASYLKNQYSGEAGGHDNISIGYNAATVRGNNDIAFGNGALVEDRNATATQPAGSGNIAFGYGAKVKSSSADDSIAFGTGAHVEGNGLAIGKGANITATTSETTNPGIAIGLETKVDVKSGIAIGNKAEAGNSGDGDAIAIGSGSKTLGTANIAIGKEAKTEGNQANALAIGTSASAGGLDGVVIGHAATTSQEYGTAIGSGANASAQYGVALGAYSVANTTNDQGINPYVPTGVNADNINATVATAGAVSVGRSNVNGSADIRRQITNVAAGSADTDAVNVAQLKALETKINSSTGGGGADFHDYSVNSIETTTDTNYNNTGATGNDALAAGVSAKSTTSQSVAVGKNAGNYNYNNATANNKQVPTESKMNASDTVVKNWNVSSDTGEGGNDAVAIGTEATTYSYTTVALGSQAQAIGHGGLAIGPVASAMGNDSTAIGFQAYALENGVAIGPSAEANGSSSTVAIGSNAKASGPVDANGKGGNDSTAIGSASRAYGVGASAYGHFSVANGAAAIAIGEGATAGGVTTVNGNTHEIDPNAMQEKAIAIGSNAKAANRESTAIGTNAEATEFAAIAAGRNMVARGQGAVAFGSSTTTSGENGTVTEADMHGAKANWATAIGVNTDATVERATAVGDTNLAAGIRATAVGSSNKAYNENAVAIGSYATAGDQNDKTKNDAVAVGVHVDATGAGSLALGNQAKATADNAIAMGTKAEANIADGVAIGSGAKTTANKDVVGYDVLGTDHSTDTTGTWKSTRAAVSIGDADNKITRQITGVAAGAADTDAVNVAQLKKVAAADKTVVAQGTNVTVTPTTDQTDGHVTYKIDADGTSVSKGDSEYVTVTKGNKDATTNITDYKVDLSDKAKEDLNKVENDGLTFTGDTGTTGVKKLGDTVAVTGDTNITTTGSETGIAIALKKDLDLGDSGSVTIGGTTVNNTGLTINNGPSFTTNNIDVNNQQIHNVTAGTDDKDAVNVKQLKDSQTIVQQGDHVTVTSSTNEKTGATTYTVSANLDGLGAMSSFNVAGNGKQTAEIKNGNTVDFVNGKNTTAVTTAKTDGSGVDVTYNLADDITLGKNGTDGVDGKIGVNGKDGSAVVINGKDGSIGLNGANGSNGVSIKGDRGADGTTRVIYETKDGTETVRHEIATLDDGLKYAGDDGQKDTTKVISKKLNEKLDIVGGADSTKLTDGNIGVNNVGGQLKVQLIKDLTGITSITNGATDNSKKTTITLGDNVVNVNNAKITNVTAGTDATDAVNVSQLTTNVAAAKTTVTSSDNSVTVQAATDSTDKHTNYDLKVATAALGNDADGKVTVTNPTVNNTENKNSYVTGEDVAEAINQSGFNVTTSASDGTVTGTTKELINPGETVTVDAGKNMAITQTGNKISIATKNELEVQKITVTGADGKDGEIGLKGKDGTNGTVTTIIKTIGKNGTDGTDGKPGVDGTTTSRIIYQDGNDTHTVATLDDGLKYGGDFGTASSVKLNKQLNVKGEAEKEADLTTGNIGVVSSQDGENGKLVVKLNKDLKGITSITNSNGTTINLGDTTGGSVVNVNNAKITNVTAGTDPTDAVNVSQLTEVKNLAGKHTEVTVEGGTAAGTDDYAGENLKLKVTDTDGKKVYDLKLANTLSIGGKDGQNGTIGVKGADGKDGVSIKGEDGSIGLKGKDGEMITIKGSDGKNGVDGTTTIKRITVDGHDVATLDDGLKFGANAAAAANGANPVANKLNTTVEVKGAGTKTVDNYSGENLYTTVSQDADGKTTINVLMDKDLKSSSVTVGTDGAPGKDGVDGKVIIKNGKDGKDGADAGIHVIKGADGVNGTNGEDGITRIVYNDGKDGKDGTDHVLATLEDGLKFKGDNDTVVHRKLNTQLDVTGGITDSSKLSDNNIGVISTDGTDTENGKLEIKLAKDLTGITSISNGTTKITLGDNVSINNVKITNVAPGTDGTDAVNVNQLTEVKNLASQHSTVSVGNVKATADDKEVKGGNLALTRSKNTDGSYNYDVKLADEITIGEKGVKGDDGKPGVDGKIGVNGKDGSGVVINGADGSIGLRGADGADGTPGKTIVIKGKDGKDGSKGVDGSTVDRVVINDKEVAMLDDGMKYSGDTGNQLKMKLNSNVNIKGGATEYSENNNIAVVADGKDTLTLRLAKNVDLGKDGTIKAGTAEMGSQTVKNTMGTEETGNYVTGLDNKTWNPKDNGIVSGRAATEDQLKSATESITDATKGGGFGLKDDSGTEVKKNLGESIGVVGGTTAGTTAKNIVTTANTKDGSIEVALAKDIDLGENGSIKAGDTTINKDGITSNKVTTGNTTMDNSGLTIKSADGDTKKDVSITNSGLNNGGNKITNVAAGEADTDAVNVSQLKEVKQVAEAHSTVSVGGTSATENSKSVTGGNLTLTRSENANGGFNYDVKLADDLSIGKAGKDGVDGKIGVNGKDGSSVVINGKDGSIGLNGKDGKNGITIKGEAGSAGLDGKDGVTRMVYETKDGETIVKHEVATLDDGMKYSGDTGDQLKMKLNENVNVVGGATTYSDKNNIAVIADGKDTLTLRLAKDITGLNSVTTNVVNTNTVNATTVNVGGTTINNEGVTINNGPTITQNKVDVAGNKIENVAPGTKATDAVNVEQLAASNNSLTHSINKLGTRVDRVGANAAALAALHPLDFDPDEKLDFAAGMGNYNGANAAAVGVFYRPNEDTMLSLGGSVGGGENMVNVGVSFKLGQHNHVTTSKVAMAKELLEMKQKMEKLEAQNKYLMDRLGAAPAPKELKDVKFPDVPTDHWAYQYVKSLADRGYLVGYPDGEFKGDRALTRYEYAAVIYRALQNGAPVDNKMADILDEFEPELEHIQKAARFRVDRISGEDNDRHKVERVRVNDEDDKEHKVYKDLYGGKIKKEVKSEK